MLRAEVGGLSVAYERTGDGPALILLHGFTQDSRVWRPQLESLSDKSVIDLLGIKFLAAATVMRDEVRSGRLDASVTETVVAAAEGLPSRPRAGPSVLSQREADVLDELARGRTTRQTATALGITEKTVRHHLEHTYDELDTRTRPAAVMMALGTGVISRPEQARGDRVAIRFRSKGSASL